MRLTAFYTRYEDAYSTNEVPRFDLFARMLTTTVLHDACQKYTRWYQGSTERLCGKLGKSPYVQSVVLHSLPPEFILDVGQIAECALADGLNQRGLYPFGPSHKDYADRVPHSFITEAYVRKLAMGVRRFVDADEEEAVWAS